MVELGLSLLQNRGYFVAESPNGSHSFRMKRPQEFHHLWGKVDPNLLTADFYSNIFIIEPLFSHIFAI